jgi:hypothetical protein
MSKRSTLLRELLRQRHWQTYATFCRRYDDAARRTDPALVGRWPSRGQFARWLSGDLKGIPHPDHCRVLEAMFPGVSAQQLVAPAPAARPVTPTGADDAPHLHVAHPPPAPAAGPTGARRAGAGAAAAVPGGVAGPVTGPAAPPAAGAGEPKPVTWIAARPRAGAAHRAAPEPAAGAPATATAAVAVPGAAAVPGQALSPSEEIAMTTEESARFVRGARGAVDADVLDQLTADVRRLAADYVSRPPITVLRPLSDLRREVFDMLDQRQRPAVLPALYGVAGRLCALLAHATGDLGHTYAADTHTRTAWLCADLAEDDDLRCFVRWVQSNAAYWGNDHRRAAELARAAQRHARGGTNLLRLASQEARAWAAAGDAREVERALATAAAAAERRVGAEPAGASSGSGRDDEAGVFRFDPGKAAYYASEVRLSLGGEPNARLARAAAEESLELFAAGPADQRAPEFVAAAQLDLAAAHLALGDLDGAAEQLRTVLRLPVESRTTPIVSRVASVARTLTTSRFAGSPLAAELGDETAVFRAYPARRDLTEVVD